jgi:acetyl esterase/lipase
VRYPSLRENGDDYYVTFDDFRVCVGNYLDVTQSPAIPEISPIHEPALSGLRLRSSASLNTIPCETKALPMPSASRQPGNEVFFHHGLGLTHGFYDMLSVSRATREELARITDDLSALVESATMSPR